MLNVLQPAQIWYPAAESGLGLSDLNIAAADQFALRHVIISFISTWLHRLPQTKPLVWVGLDRRAQQAGSIPSADQTWFLFFLGH